MDKPETHEQHEIHFYYNREERLKKAGPLAQYAVSLHTRKKPGFFAALTATAPLKFLFFSIIVLALFIFGYQIYQNFEKSIQINGTSYSVQTMIFDNTLYVVISRKPPTKKLAPKAELQITYRDRNFYETMLEGELEKGIKINDVQKHTSLTISISQQGYTKTITKTLQ